MVTSENPADCATRGLPPTELKDFDLWWRGPEWLTRKQGDWPSTEIGQELVIRYSHTLTLHGGAQLTLAHARQRFWILTGRQAVRRVLRKCVRCFRTRPTTSAQLMGDLPLHRVNPPNRPFLATGVDYTGAIELKAARLRGTSFYKGYIAVFICLATKAVHLEAVTGLTTEHFLLALDRFTGRRGMAAGGLREAHSPKARCAACQRGLWEANVKSVKHHLKRVIAERRLTYEELSTVLISIEACLNSRPLCPFTADADDLEVLTPAHFLIGNSMLAPPEYRPQSKSFAEQFLIQQSMIRHFWKAWSRDWLAHLQQRPKWCHEAEGLQLNDLVIIKDDRFLPSQWLLGRVVELHPGTDALVRVVTLKTKQGQLKRFCPAYYPQDGLDTRRCLMLGLALAGGMFSFAACPTVRESDDQPIARSSLDSAYDAGNREWKRGENSV
ncbi:uncharacterized protein [Drosophila kikkawai]|uniref:DUF5641 domain-containing protein n=1 Tax=Drosophila kikkawai TaxID=30033 RepID=A0ABM4GHY5_DROKI